LPGHSERAALALRCMAAQCARYDETETTLRSEDADWMAGAEVT